MVFTNNGFISLFNRDGNNSFSQWVKNATVRSGKKMTPLNIYSKQRNISIEHLNKLYQHIVNRNEYLERFFNKSLKIEPLTIIDKPMSRSNLDNNSKVNYKNIIRNMHLLDILKNTKSGLIGLPSFLNVLSDLYLHDIIDYKILTPSALFYLVNGRIGSVFSSFYFRASIMNPYLVFSLNHNVLHGTKIFTPTLGWTSYAYGFSECPQVIEYVGVDVIPSVCKKTLTFLQDNYPKLKKDIYCQPSESLLNNYTFMKKYKNHFDVVFFSPPYYELELYPGKNQSTTVYKSYQEWLDGYWTKTIELCFKVLQKNGTLCYILSSGGGSNSGDILKDMNNITKKSFSLKSTIPMYNKNVHVTSGSHRETSEYIFIFKRFE
jgi:hypothetical protein